METKKKVIPIIAMDHISKQYSTGVEALSDVSIRIHKGEFVFVVGKSGSGKSTFIKLLLKELNPTEGRIFVGGRQVTNLKRKQVSLYRRKIGVVFQDFRLLKNKTVFENVAFAQEIIGMTKRDIARNVPIMLEMVGLKGKEKMYPHELSGGEQQRVAHAVYQEFIPVFSKYLYYIVKAYKAHFPTPVSAYLSSGIPYLYAIPLRSARVYAQSMVFSIAFSDLASSMAASYHSP